MFPPTDHVGDLVLIQANKDGKVTTNCYVE